jgi:hypothetical protein
MVSEGNGDVLREPHKEVIARDALLLSVLDRALEKNDMNISRVYADLNGGWDVSRRKKQLQ